MTDLALAPDKGRTKSHRRFRVPTSAPPSLKELGIRMREARSRRGYSQADVARLVDVAKQTICNWETGECPPKLDSLLRFATAMHIDPADLFTGLSADLAPTEEARRRLRTASQVIPLYKMRMAGDILMHTLDPKTAEPERYIATLKRHPPEAVAFAIRGRAMEPRFVDGDIVTIMASTMAEPGTLVLAYVKARSEPFVFRRFAPRSEGRIEGAILRAVNTDHPDIEMADGDAILGTLVEHISSRSM